MLPTRVGGTVHGLEGEGLGSARAWTRAREELLKLQAGQLVRVQLTGVYDGRSGPSCRIGLSAVDVRMLENADMLQWGAECVVVVRGQVRTIGKRGALRLLGGASYSATLSVREITAVEVVG